VTATAVQNPLTSPADDVAHTRRILALQDGPVVLAGHSSAGTVITEASTHPKVADLIYIAARTPDAGEDYPALAQRFPAPPANAGLVYTDGSGALTQGAFLNDVANGVDPAAARVLYAIQGRVSDTLFRTASPWPPGSPNPLGTRSAGRIARSHRSFSGPRPNACRRQQSRSTPVTSR
jgi:Alpha/beta hydrolase family